jgi:hypothetical protein
MRLPLLLLLSCLAAAAPPSLQAPRPALSGLSFKAPNIPWWNSAEKARVASWSSPAASVPSLGQPKPDRLLLPYPSQAPPNARTYFYFQ